MPAALQLDIVSDIVCPWCYIGKRRLEKALTLWAHAHPDLPAPELKWLPFQLNPDLPERGMSRSDYLLRKFGQANGGDIYERVSAEGKKEGLDFAFERIQRQPNTLKAHALLAAALSHNQNRTPSLRTSQQAALKEALMRAYFCEGADLTQDNELIRIAVSVGMLAEVAQGILNNRTLMQEVSEQDAELRRMGINGVPFFILNRQVGVSGAQPPEALLAAMQQAQAMPPAAPRNPG